MDELHAWLQRQFDDKRVEPNSALGEAINYLLKRWVPLMLFLRQAGTPLDNNVCEWALKKAILHRKNSMFYKTRNGEADRLLNLHLADRIDELTFAEKHTELRDRLSRIKLQLEVLDRDHDETAELAVKSFELSQSLRERWLTADYATKRRILEILCLNCVLDDATLVFTMRKPFDLLAGGGFVLSSRGNKTAIELFRYGVRDGASTLLKAIQTLATIPA